MHFTLKISSNLVQEVLFFVFEPGSYCVAQDDLELSILLPQAYEN
jgi:hypothetical protein